ncbi:MAG: hypothetical protein JHC33_13565 [Ignisphaera sp.]|nr:hypothetical protein [Ignisphaera sp.]
MAIILDRRGNQLPPVVNQYTRTTIDRESMLYSYQNTVESSYVGDVRHTVSKFGEYLKTKNHYIDVIKNMAIEFPVRYAAPNLVFSDNLGANGVAEETSIKDRIVLPVISYYLKGWEYDSNRAVDPCVRHSYKPDKNDPSKTLVTTSPKAMNYSFQVDIWTETRESFNQIITAFQLDFNPYSHLMDMYAYEDETQKSNYVPYVRMKLTSYSDASNTVPGTDRRVVRGTLNITVEGWLTQPPTQMSYVFNTSYTIDGSVGSTNDFNGITYAPTSLSSTSFIETSSMPSSVSSVFGRQGIVVQQPGDYTPEQIVVDQAVTGLAGVGDTLQTAISNINTKIAKDTFSIIVSEPMTPGTVFRIINQKAYKVKSIDSTTPSVDGIVLTAGNTNEVVTAGRKINTEYDLGVLQNTDGWLYLGSSGNLTSVIPTVAAGDVYLLVVGKSISGTTSFILDPKTPVKLIG